MAVDPTDFQDSDNILETADAMHKDVEEQRAEGEISDEEADDKHQEINYVVENMPSPRDREDPPPDDD